MIDGYYKGVKITTIDERNTYLKDKLTKSLPIDEWRPAGEVKPAPEKPRYKKQREE